MAVQDLRDNGAAPSSERFLADLAARRADLSRSERRVADFVLENPGEVIHMSISSLAEQVGVSQPTVLRFVRSIGLQRYPDLKLLTGQSIVSGTPYVHSKVDPDDGLDQVVAKVLDSSILVLNELRRTLDRVQLDKALDVLAAAPRIDCFGTGAASILAIEAQQKLMRFGIPVVSYGDTHLQRLAAASLRPGDVALCFSHTGQVRDTVEMARKAGEQGATVICFTRPDTELARNCAILLAIDAHEDTEIYSPMTSRVAHAALIDIVSTALALRFGPEMSARLRRAKDSLSDLRLPPTGGRG